MMKKFTTLLLALVLSLSTFLGLTTVSNVHAEEENAPVAKEPINLYREELATYSDIMTMRDSKLIYDGGVYFNALSFFNNNATGDGNVYVGAYMGLAEGENYFDFTKYASINLEVHGLTDHATWLSALLIDADGDCVRIKTNITFTGKRAGGEELTNYADPSSDWHGTFVGHRHGTLTYTQSSFELYQGGGTTKGNGSFDFTKIVAMTTRIMIYDRLWIETGKLTAKDAEGNESVLFDPATATQVTELTTVADINKGEWAFSNNPATFGQAIKAGSMTYIPKLQLTEEAFAAYESAMEHKHFDFYKTANGGDPWLRTVDSTNKDQSYAGFAGYDGIAFDIDTTGATGKDESGYIELDVYLRVGSTSSSVDYKAFGNQVNAKLVSEDGTVIFNSEYKKGANWLPVGFKGTVYLPFAAFENGANNVTSINGFENRIIRVGLIPVNQTWAIGDHVIMSNIHAYDCVSHADANHNQVCDICTEAVPCVDHVDEDHDQACDYCEAEVPCVEHVDEDHDQACDYCEAEVPCVDHVDEDGNDVCDYCDANLAEQTPDSGNSSSEDKNADLKSCTASLSTLPFAVVLLAGAVYTVIKRRK